MKEVPFSYFNLHYLEGLQFRAISFCYCSATDLLCYLQQMHVMNSGKLLISCQNEVCYLDIKLLTTAPGVVSLFLSASPLTTGTNH